MYILFFLLWIIFNGQITLEIVLFGLVISAAVYAFCCKFMGYKPRRDWLLICRSGYILLFIGVLILEIIKANAAVMKLILTPHLRVEPVMVRFRTDLNTRIGRVLLANAITLTPGTITVSLKNNEYLVHCLDRQFAEGLSDSVFIRYLKRIEGQDR